MPAAAEPTRAGWYVGEGEGDDGAIVVTSGWQRLVVCPRVNDMSCGERSLPVDAAQRYTTPQLLAAMSSKPLEPIGLPAFTIEVADSSAADRVQPPAAELADLFDVSRHPQAQSYVAKQMLERLTDDVRRYAAGYSGQSRTVLRLVGLQPADLHEC
eukprot:3842543-Prymnesium_polylepis.2